MKSCTPIFLLLVHVPFLIGYVDGLQTDSVYQFGPIAWSIVALMFWRRNGGRLESNGRHRVFHVIVDVVCVALAVVTGEFAFGVLGGCVWIHVFLKQWRGSPIGSSLGYLCLILLLTVRVPVAAADRVLQEMNECAVRMASWFLDQFHYLHVTTPDSIEVSGHSFPIHQIGDDVFSMPAPVCLSCVFLCIMRRRWVHAVSSLAICSIIAVLMQAAKLYGTVVVWQNSVTGAAVSVGGLTLSATVFALALLSVISWDMLLSAFTEPVPLMATSTINPLAIFWNSFFLTHAEKQLDDDPDEVVPDVRSVLDEVPSVFPMLGPWTADFLFSWFITRSRRRILLGLPSIALAVAGIALWTNADSVAQINGRYDAALAEAVDQNREADLELAVRRLQRSDVDTFAIRFLRVQRLISLGSKDDAIFHLRTLTPPDAQGYVPARLWLVRQSDAADVLIPMTEEQRQQQLRRAVHERRTDAEAHVLLGKSYLRQRQTRLAEFHMTTAVELDPKYAAELLVLQKALGRSPQELVQQAAAAIQKLKQRLSQEPDDQQSRISLARIFAVLADAEQAESLLQDGLAIEESTDLKQSLSAVYAGMAIDLFSRKPLNQTQTAELGQKAVLLNPANSKAISILFKSVQSTSMLDPITLRPALVHWRQQLKRDVTCVQNRLHLMQLLTVCGLFDEAIEVLKPIADMNVNSQAHLARLFVLAGRTDEARGVTDGLLRELRSGATDDENAVVAVAQVLLIENRLQEVVDLLQPHVTESNRPPGAELAARYVQSGFALFDQKAAADESFVGTEQSLELLQRIHSINPAMQSIAPRLAKIAGSQGVAADAANQLVLRILTQGKLNAAVYSAVGAESILQEDLDKAVVNLQQALALAQNDPVVLNNLAIALVRRSKDNAGQALQLAQQALSIVPGHLELLATRGEILLALNRLSEARQDLSAVLAESPTHELAQRLLAEIAD